MENQKRKISIVSRVALILAATALVVANYMPIWQIELDAPQYPEGLNLKIYADKLGGNVDIINGLNHYIGMKTLHTEDFVEFQLIPYFLYGYAFLALFAAIVGSRKFSKILLIAFIAFGVVAMADFWRWEYDYGHDLDPNAAIIVPGMAYQPPLIGFKQLLNFGAYSIPDIGGWLIVLAGVFMVFVVAYEFWVTKKLNRIAQVAAIVLLLFTASCTHKPQGIKINKDSCAYCEMTISDIRYASELMTDKGKIYTFDDLSCMFRFMKENTKTVFEGKYVNDFMTPNTLQNLESMHFIKGGGITSPMGGNMASFSNKDSAAVYARTLGAEILSDKVVSDMYAK